jgi:uncharacterized protein YacL
MVRIDSAIREHLAENMKERVYATITLLAVIATLWQTADHHSVKGTLASIVGTVIGLWLATLIAGRVSHRAVYQKSMHQHELAKLLFTSSGLLVPALVPSLLVLLSGTGVISLQDALLGGMVVLLLSLFTLSFMAGRKIYTSRGRVILISSLETLVGVGVIALKILVGE